MSNIKENDSDSEIQRSTWSRKNKICRVTRPQKAVWFIPGSAWLCTVCITYVYTRAATDSMDGFIIGIVLVYNFSSLVSICFILFVFLPQSRARMIRCSPGVHSDVHYPLTPPCQTKKLAMRRAVMEAKARLIPEAPGKPGAALHSSVEQHVLVMVYRVAFWPTALKLTCSVLLHSACARQPFVLMSMKPAVEDTHTHTN